MKDSVTISIALYDMPESDTLEVQAAEFEALTHVGVSVSRLSAEEMEKKVLEEFETRTDRYDIVDVSAAAVPALSPHVEVLDDRIAQSQAEVRVEDWSAHVLDLYSRYRGQMVTLPWRASAYLLCYRRDLFEIEGVEPPTDLDELLEAVKRFHHPEKNLYGFASAQRNGLHICLDWLAVLWGFGGEIYSGTTSSLLTSKEAAQALEYYVERNKYAVPGVLDFEYLGPVRCMQEGQVAMIQQWSMAARHLENQADSKVSGKVGYLPVPGCPVIGGGGLGINAYSTRKEAAWEFLKWFTSPEVEKKRARLGGSPTRISTLQDPELLGRQPQLAANAQALAQGRVRPAHPEWNKIQDVVGEAVWLTCSGIRKPREALASASAQVEEILDLSKEFLLLDTVSSLTTFSLAVEEILKTTLRETIELKGADTGITCLLDDTSRAPLLAFRWRKSSRLVEKIEPGEIVEGLLQRVIESEEPCLVELHSTGTEIFKNEPSDTRPPRGLRSLVGFRLGTQDRPLGVVILAFGRARRVRQQEINLLSVIGRQSGQALENARRYEQEKHYSAELEVRVAERTAELEAFTYSVSHDLRAPLRHIDGFSKLLLEEHGAGLSNQAQHYLTRVRDGTRRMGMLVDDLLNLSRLGRRDLSLRLTGLGSLVEEVRGELAADTVGRQIEWQVGPLPFVECDPALMKQVFANLLSNALKFTRTREKAVIQIGLASEDDPLVVFVRDNGVGFSMKYADKLFGVFQRLHRQEDFEGTGVGLATVQRIIQKHGGRVWAEGELNQGATFYFTLGAPRAGATPEAAISGGSSCQPPR